MKRRCLVIFAGAILSALVASTPKVDAQASPSPTQPPEAVVKQACVPSGVDYTVTQWNFVSPYLLCYVSDKHTGTAKLFMQSASGAFSLVSHGGGDLPLAGLEALGVPATTAQLLLAGLHT